MIGLRKRKQWHNHFALSLECLSTIFSWLANIFNLDYFVVKYGIWLLKAKIFYLQFAIRSFFCFSLLVKYFEEYSAHDWRGATSVQRAPVTWREWGLWIALYDIPVNIQIAPAIMSLAPFSIQKTGYTMPWIKIVSWKSSPGAQGSTIPIMNTQGPREKWSTSCRR